MAGPHRGRDAPRCSRVAHRRRAAVAHSDDARMTGERDNDRSPWWDPMGVWQPIADLTADQWRAAWPSKSALQVLLDGVRAGMVGRPAVIGAGANRVAFTLSSLETTIGHMAAASGQADDLRLSAENVEFRHYQFASVSAQFYNVHSRLRARALLVSAPIDVSLTMTGQRLTTLLAGHVRAVRVEISDAGRMLVRPARRPRWLSVEVRPAVEKGALVVRPTGWGRGARMWRIRWKVFPLRPNVALPDGVRLTAVKVHPNRLEVDLRVDEWKLDVSELAALARVPQ